MKADRPQFLIVLFIWVGFCGPGSLVKAQSSDHIPVESKEFGYSLKIPEKEKKGKAKSFEPNPSSGKIENPSNGDEIIRIETTMILNEILVFDERGNPIKDLKKEDFFIKEDGEPQEINTFTLGHSEAIPRSIVLIIDFSNSQLPFIETSLKAAKVLIDKLNPHDRIAIVTDDVKLLQSFTSDKNLLKEKLESIKTPILAGQAGSSKQYSALMATLRELFDDTTSRPIIIFQTDGDELANLKGESVGSSYANLNFVNFNLRDILTATEKIQATVYSIIPGLCFNDTPGKDKLKKAKRYLEQSDIANSKLYNIPLKPGKTKRENRYVKALIDWLQKNESGLRRVAKSTGGATKCLEQIDQAEQIYAEILSEMNERYVIGYYPKNQVRDGKSRNVTTVVHGQPKYKILGRKSYIF